MYDELQGSVDDLKAQGVTLRHAVRRVVFKGEHADATPLPISVLYLITYRAGQEPNEFTTPRKLRLF